MVLAWAALGLLALGEWESPVRAGSLVLCAWVRAELLGQVEVIGPATGGLVIGAAGIGAVDVSGPGGAWALASHWPPRGHTTAATATTDNKLFDVI